MMTKNKTPGKPDQCPLNNCSGCKFFQSCREKMLAKTKESDISLEVQERELGLSRIAGAGDPD